MMAVDVATTPVFSAGTPRMLFENRYQRAVLSDFVCAERFADIAIQVNLHVANVSRTGV